MSLDKLEQDLERLVLLEPILSAIEAKVTFKPNFVSNKRISKAGFRGIREHIRGHESKYHFCLRWYDLEKQARQLSAGVDIIVGTYGRLWI